MEVLAARGISKYFGETRVLANDALSLSLRPGETRAVVGENGAGKSTLARILAGLLAPDSGSIEVRGRPLRLGSVRAAEDAGIGFVPQVSLLAGGLTVAENIVLGREPRLAGLLVSRRKAYVETAMLVERFGFRLDPEAPVSSLSASERRQAEIARALARGGEVLVLDEPTSILAESEAASFLRLLRGLASAGKAIVLITHRLPEALEAADSITVLRAGKIVAELGAGEADEARLSRLMARTLDTGSSASVPTAAGSGPPARTGTGPALELRGLRLSRRTGPLSLEVERGEIVAVISLGGNGLDRLEDLASGTLEVDSGEVRVLGRRIDAIPRGVLRSELMAYVPSDREGRGLCLAASVRENALVLRRQEFGALAWMGGSERDEAARDEISVFGLKADTRVLASSLSGGNRQRLLLARELDRPRPVLILAEPLQSLDLAAQERVARRVRELRGLGSAVLLLVSSVEEALALADRVLVLYRGELAFEGPNEGSVMAPRLVAAMTGSQPPEPSGTVA